MAVNTVPVQLRFITVEEYDQMVQAGVFPEDDRIELIEGNIITMSPIGAAHAGHVNRLLRLLAPWAGQVLITVQNPIRLPGSEPQPDFALLKSRVDDYAGAHPTARDVLLVVEVSDTSVDYDRSVKIPLYGRNGIPEAWLIDLEHQLVEVYRGPSAAGYREKHTFGPGEQLLVQALADFSLFVADILGV